jgi:diacylglycerol kinase family enzyme
MPLVRALKLLSIVRKGEHADLLEATFSPAKSAYIEARQPVNVQTGGETGSASSFDARIVPWPSGCTREG